MKRAFTYVVKALFLKMDEITRTFKIGTNAKISVNVKFNVSVKV